MIVIIHHLYNSSLINLKKGSKISKLTTRIKPTEWLVKYFKVSTLSLFDFNELNSQEVIVPNNTDYLDNKRKTTQGFILIFPMVLREHNQREILIN